MRAAELPGQIVIPAAAVGLAFLCVMGTGLVIVMAWALACWWRDRRDRRHDVGPDGLKLLKDLDAHMERFVLGDPEVAAGLDRLFKELGPPPARKQEGESA